jgi:2-keto-4-pentenoate hydratase/2-oxohepta-3-ene-1,7-dioic acid hydratase in catechol pathway
MAVPLDPRPGKVLAIARNYADHAAERGTAPPAEPTAFLKPSSCLIGPGDAIVLPALSAEVDFEAELAVVIGRAARHVPAARALEHVAGYTILNDVTARDLQRTDGQWARAKGMDTFGPVGPRLVAAADVPDPHALRIRLWLSGELMQDGSTGDMVHRVPKLVEHLSAAFTLEPGDLIATGTPAGVGAGRTPPRFLRPGDVVRIEIDGLGVLENPVVAAP